jgi:hypothetical protein
MLDLRRRSGRVGGREVWNSGPSGRRCRGDWKISLRTWGGTGLLVGTCRRDGGDARRGFGVDMVRRPSLGMVTLDGHEIFKIVLENLG